MPRSCGRPPWIRRCAPLRRVDLEDAAAADEIFSVLMGDDVVARRSFITKNARDVRFLDV